MRQYNLVGTGRIARTRWNQFGQAMRVTCDRVVWAQDKPLKPLAVFRPPLTFRRRITDGNLVLSYSGLLRTARNTSAFGTNHKGLTGGGEPEPRHLNCRCLWSTSTPMMPLSDAEQEALDGP